MKGVNIWGNTYTEVLSANGTINARQDQRWGEEKHIIIIIMTRPTSRIHVTRWWQEKNIANKK